MKLCEAFAQYGTRSSSGQGELQSTCLALRRAGVDTIERLAELYCGGPGDLETIRGIGPQRMELIGKILSLCEAGQAPPPEPRA